MSWQEIEGNWRQFAGEAKQRWRKLTDNDLAACEGNREILVGKLQELYGMTADKAGEEIALVEDLVSEARKGVNACTAVCNTD